MNKNEKLLNKISTVDKEKILIAIDSILADDLKFLDIKKLKGCDNEFRVRVGRFRIKFIKYKNYNEVTEVTHRNDNTY